MNLNNNNYNNNNYIQNNINFEQILSKMSPYELAEDVTYFPNIKMVVDIYKILSLNIQKTKI